MRTRTAPEADAAEAPATERRVTRRGTPVAGRAAAATATAFAATLATIARLVRLVGGLIFLLIALAIVLFDVKANPSNGVVKAIHDAAHFFTSPFTGMFHVHGIRTAFTLNWGVAAIIYLVAAGLIAWLITAPIRGRRRAV